MWHCSYCKNSECVLTLFSECCLYPDYSCKAGPIAATPHIKSSIFAESTKKYHNNLSLHINDRVAITSPQASIIHGSQASVLQLLQLTSTEGRRSRSASLPATPYDTAPAGYLSQPQSMKWIPKARDFGISTSQHLGQSYARLSSVFLMVNTTCGDPKPVSKDPYNHWKPFVRRRFIQRPQTRCPEAQVETLR